MRRLSLILAAYALLAGCKTTTYNDFYVGVDYSKRSDVSITSFGLGFQGRPMFSERIGLVYQVGFLLPMAVDYRAYGLSVRRDNLSSGVGIHGFIAPSFKVLDINEKISLFVSPGLNTGQIFLTKNGEVETFDHIRRETHEIDMNTLGIGVDISTDFYLGKYFFMRFGVLLGLDLLSSDSVYFGDLLDSSTHGVTQFRAYPKLGIGWRRTKEQN